MELHRFWIQIDVPRGSAWQVLKLGCGVTATCLDDALALVKDNFFSDANLPPIVAVVENIDVATLDEAHVRQNMGSPSNPGIWFPRLQ